ncbi:MAG TPA: carboxypeptidase-like regulatory domain-containing protein [Thermoanaerobaculia bacterium]|nr:carboxypeptidase-like regulatory domain-containing protein [Thermoanaerobaculia bacterium]
MLRLFILLAAASSSAHAASISGTVRDASGAPLAGARVSAYQTNGNLAATVSTDGAGAYIVQSLSAGSYRLLAYDPAGNFATSFYRDAPSFEESTEISLQSSQSLSNIHFQLVRGGTVTGTVKTSNGTPIERVIVAAYNVPSGTRRGFTTTDTSGRYRLVLPPGEYRVAAFDESLRYATTFFDDAGTFHSAAPVHVQPGETTGTLDFQLRLAALVSGTVRSPAGVRLSGIRISAYDAEGHVAATALSDLAGEYRLALREGAYRVVFEDPSGEYAAVFYGSAESFDVAPPLIVSSGQTVAGVDAVLPRAAHIAGRVIDAGTGAPLPLMTVTAFNVPGGTTRTFTTTNAAGEYQLNVPPGVYRIGAYDPNGAYATRFYRDGTAFADAEPVSVSSGQRLSGLQIALPKGGRLRGEVRDASSGAVAASITIAAYDSMGRLVATVKTDPSGRYTLVLSPGTYRVTAFDETLFYANAYLDGAVNLEMTRPTAVAAEAILEGQNFSLIRAARISGSVSEAASGRALPGITVTAYDRAGFAVLSATSGPDGTFQFPLPPGMYRFVAADPAGAYLPLFYPQSATLAGAGEYTVTPGSALTPLAFRLAPPIVNARRRSARH